MKQFPVLMTAKFNGLKWSQLTGLKFDYSSHKICSLRQESSVPATSIRKVFRTIQQHP